MKKNWTLLAGGLIIFGLAIIMLLPNLFTSSNPYGTQSIQPVSSATEQFAYEKPPFHPGPGARLGTDEMGRDILSLIIYGTRLTLGLGLLVVLGRYLVALPLGIAAGFGSYGARTAINQSNVIFSAIPALIFSVIVLKMNFFSNLAKGYSILAFVLVLTLVGWAKLASIINERVQAILAQPFIRGEIAIGKSNRRIVLENVLPHLATELVVLFFMEMAGALTMLMQLGIFGAFVGNMRFVVSTDGGVVTFLNMSFEPEWAGMLATARNYILTAPWLVLSPAASFFVSILGFNLFGEGLRGLLQRRDSRFIVYLRRMLTGNLKGLIPARFRGLSGKVAIGLVSIIVLLLLKDLWWPGGSVFDTSRQTLAPLPVSSQGVLIGTPEANSTASQLAKAMQTMGLKQVSKEGFIVPYTTPAIFTPAVDQVEVVEGEKTIPLVKDKDFTFGSFGDLDLRGKVYDARHEDLFAADFGQYSGKFVLIDSSYYAVSATSQLIEKIMTNSQAKGVMCVQGDGEALPKSVGNNKYKGVVLWITPAMAESVTAKGAEVKVTLRSKQLESKGENVIGMLPGQDVKQDQETIIIGLGYNYLPGEEKIGQERVQFGLELAKQLQGTKRNRNIVIAFWDGSVSDQFCGVWNYAASPLLPPHQSVLYLDLTGIAVDEADSVYFNSSQAAISRYFAWSMGHQLEQAFGRAHLQVQDSEKISPTGSKEISYNSHTVMLLQAGIPTLNFYLKRPPLQGAKAVSLDDLGRVVLETVSKNSY